jgi:hypothetical protein
VSAGNFARQRRFAALPGANDRDDGILRRSALESETSEPLIPMNYDEPMNAPRPRPRPRIPPSMAHPVSSCRRLPSAGIRSSELIPANGLLCGVDRARPRRRISTISDILISPGNRLEAWNTDEPRASIAQGQRAGSGGIGARRRFILIPLRSGGLNFGRPRPGFGRNG